MRHRSGEWRDVLSRAHVVRGADGQPAQLVGTILDVTEHRRTQVELVEALKAAQAANQAKSEFLAMMSHELRTPLHAILGMSELLLDAELEPPEHHYAEIVRDSATTLRDIIRDILDTSRIEAGKLELRRVPFDLRDLLSGFFDRYALRAHTKGIDFYEVLDPALPRTVIGDPTRLRQILDNLASNALKFTAEGTITVEVSGCADADADAVDLEFRVRDTGVGIPADAHDRLFQPFVQVDGSTSRSFDGTGLGLMIARQLASMMGGELRLEESAPDRGSTFLFRCALPLAPTKSAPLPRMPPTRVAAVIRSPGFVASLRADCAAIGATLEVVDDVAALGQGEAPDVVLVESRAPPRPLPAPPAVAVDAGWRTIVVLEPSGSALAESALALGWERCLLRPFRRETLRRSLVGDEAESPASPPPKPARRDATILLVEDNLVNREVAVAMLGALGFTAIDHAENGAVAIEKATAKTYDLILMDCVMPKVDGFEATRRLRAAGYSGPIVAMTANALERERRRGAEAGMDEFATKPLGQERLAGILGRWIGAARGPSR
jgi:signal transduction histidine kinase/CheY-like chemotaxis protein